ncbi:hypothetical protein CBP12_01540 [Oceanisphaera avium]|uniref:Peptide methionine sulfoxide reductase MsrA n=2 Tax=Oceanisphaera avium TaxID=1903694 RepID=A0A1Y0D0G0_9GAMM|nr:hypothetical protein CBP12_01540 [Oceanisphaera avium]
MEALFAERTGVSQVEVGWIQASRTQTRRQVVRIQYDAKQINYGDLLGVYWAAIDATDRQGQYCDRGVEFSPALYVRTPLQQRWAQQSRTTQALALNKAQLAVRILPPGQFVKAPASQQQYYQKHPWLYANYRWRCGYPSEKVSGQVQQSSAPLATTALFESQFQLPNLNLVPAPDTAR